MWIITFQTMRAGNVGLTYQNPTAYTKKRKRYMTPKLVPTDRPFLAPNFLASFSLSLYLYKEKHPGYHESAS